MFNFAGRLRFNVDAAPLAETRFELFDANNEYGWFGGGKSDENGNFSIQLSDETGTRITTHENIVRVRVYKGNTPVYETTLPSVVSGSFNTIVIPVAEYDNAVPDETHLEETPVNYSIVYGTVTSIKGLPLNDIAIRIFEAGFRTSTLIANALTNSRGYYEAKIATKQVTHSAVTAERSLYVDGVTVGGVVVATSELLPLLGPRIECNLLVSADGVIPTSEFSAILNAIHEITGSAPIAAITTDGTSSEAGYLAKATGIPYGVILNVVTAHQYAEGTTINPKYFYALMRTTQGLDRGSLVGLAHKPLFDLISKAITDVIIDPATETEINTAVDAMQGINVTMTKNASFHSENRTLAEALNVVFPDDSALVNSYLNYAANFGDGNTSNFWAEFQLAHGPTNTRKLQKGLQLLAITGFQPDLARILVYTSTADDTHQFASRRQDEWEEIINFLSTASGTSIVPKIIRDTVSTDSAAVPLYAAKLREIFQNLYPLSALKAKFDGTGEGAGAALIADSSVRTQVSTFIGNNPNFDLRFQSVYDINGTDYNLTGVESVGAVQSALEPFQRMTRIVGAKTDAVAHLVASSINSAHDIVTISRDVFVEQNSILLGSAQDADRVYSRAQQTSVAASNAVVSIVTNRGNNTSETSAWPSNFNAESVANPQLATLFGSLEQCGCEYCMSVYSPSAYYVDILNFLKTNSIAAYTELTRRRSDLPFIDLTCKNSNTPLPYVDLVNELLEKIILKQLSVTITITPPDSFQTIGKAAELAARPEHVIRVGTSSDYVDYPDYHYVYDSKLNTASYPDNLPFNLGLEEARVYLKHLGVSRYEAMRLYSPWNPSAIPAVLPTGITPMNLLTESLEISKEAADIIVDTTGTAIWQFYGFPGASVSNLISPSDTSVFLSGTWTDLLLGNVSGGGIDVLMHQLRLSYKELRQLLATRFLNPVVGGSRQVKIKPDDGTCILKNLHLEVPPAYNAAAFFGRLHRFVRLWRATGISIYALDQLLHSVGATDIDGTAYSNVARTLLLSNEIGLTPDRLSAWWSDIDTERYPDYNSERQDPIPSLYDQLFLSKSVLNPPDPAYSTFNSGGQPVFSINYQDHTAAIIAALGIKEDELIALMVAHHIVLPTTPVVLSTPITFSDLSWLFAAAVISRGLGMGVKDFIRFSLLAFPTLTGSVLNAVTGTALAQLDILDEMKAGSSALATSGFTLDESIYLLRNEDPAGAFIPKEQTIQLFYEGLRKELKKIQSTDNLSNKPAALANAIVQQFAAQFGIGADIARYLLGTTVTGTLFLRINTISGTPTSIDLLTAFSDEGFIGSTYDLSLSSINPAAGVTLIPAPDWNLNDLFYAYYRVAKIAFIVNRLKIKQPELESLVTNRGTLVVTDLAALPVKAGDAKSAFEPFMSFSKWLKVRDRLRLNTVEFVALTGNTLAHPLAKGDWKAILVAATGWDDEVFDDVAGPVTEATNAPSGLLHAVLDQQAIRPEFIDRVADVMDANKRIGLIPDQLVESLYSTIQLEDAHKILNAARSKKTDSEWLKVAKPLHDVLREKQRQALVAYVIANRGVERWRNENDLYAYLLIDVEMSPCMKTSRIKQAISSVQLFIDRVIMKLEYVGNNPVSATITMSPATITQWKTWRKWYRVWEANRKIFLYPENWIEPELRDDKSPFFKELETQLLQDEVKTEKVEQAYYEYLEKVDEVARLEPVTCYHESEPENGIDIIHAVARTYSQPQHYYYRRLENNKWSPWERMNIEIKGDHVTIVIWNRRLYIFWLTFIDKAPTPDETVSLKKFLDTTYMADGLWVVHARNILNDRFSLSNMGDTGDDRVRYWNILLNWSEQKEGKWLSPKVSKDAMELKPYKVQLNERNRRSYYDKTYHYGFTDSQIYSVFAYLTKNRELKINELFRNKLYLLPQINPNNNELILSIVFGGGLDEYYISLHAFLFPDSSTDPHVFRESDAAFQFISPVSTIANNMKFVQSVLPVGSAGNTGTLRTDGYDWIHALGYYQYNADSLLPPARSGYMPVHKYDIDILRNIPYGQFRITARADMAQHGEIEIKPMENDFFFEDKYNNFFVRKVEVAQDVASVVAIRQPENIALSNIGEVYYLDYRSSFGRTIFSPPLDGINSAFSFGTPITNQANSATTAKYYFQTFYHPHIHKFIKALNKDGIDGLLKIENQIKVDSLGFSANYQPTSLVINTARNPYPTNIVDFKFDGAYAIYNWELFFHIPMIVAQNLSMNQQFEDAQKWYHYVFNPTSNTNDQGAITGSKQRFWRFRPFYEEAAAPITTLAAMLAHINNYLDQIQAWEAHPFQPHVIARMRIIAYMKNVVMKYLDNLIAWGDQLFRRDTIESINEATQLYILAANILGPRPQEIPSRITPTINNFQQLLATGTLDYFSNAKVKAETFIDPSRFSGTGGGSNSNTESVLQMLYFCLPNNEKLLGYWDTIADRLFKIRNCMNIEGVRQELPLFEPPIDPALLVRAAAAGVDINSILNEVSGIGQPLYRFSYILQKANELVADVKSLGNSILSALEKKDAEHLALLRAGQEIDLLDKVTYIKESQLNEAKSALEALQKTRENTMLRLQYYSSRPFMNAGEIRHLESVQEGMLLQIEQAVMETAASVLSLIPQFHAQVTFAVGASFGGQQLSTATHAVATAMGIKGIINNTKGILAATTGGYQRRQDDWTFQADTAKKELEQLDKQLIGAEIRISIAERELTNHLKQIENSQAVDDYMRQKFTNEELYNWMISQIAAIYFQSYQLAYDLAAKTELCYEYELPLAIAKKPAGGFIKFGYWDSLRKGLLSGERLQYDLRKIELAYMEENKRGLELTKHISLASLNPEALLKLRSGDFCIVDIPEWLYDLDYPGQYMRRIKSISISIPCVAGPYTTVSCRLSLVSHKYRKLTSAGSGYAEITGGGDNRFNYSGVVSEAIATSRAQNDSGMFELSFRDERYLPFEGAGAISSWKIELPAAYAQFDYNSISDVILHINYTAAEDDILKAVAATYARDTLKALVVDHGFMRLFSLRHEFANEWFAYASAFAATPGPITIKLHTGLFPYYSVGKKIAVAPLYIKLRSKAPLAAGYTLLISYKDSSGTHAKSYPLTGSANNEYVFTYDVSHPSPDILPIIDGNTKIMKLMLKNAVGVPVNMDELLDDLYLVTLNDLGTLSTTQPADDTDWTTIPVTPPPPTIPTTGLVAWWKAEEGITTVLNSITGNDEVTDWVDQSGAGNHLTASAVTLRPIYHLSGGPNGTKFLSFDGNRRLDRSSFSIPANTKDITIIVIAKNLNTANTAGFLCELTADTDSNTTGFSMLTNNSAYNTVEFAHKGDVGYSLAFENTGGNNWIFVRGEGLKSKSTLEARVYVNGGPAGTVPPPFGGTFNDNNSNDFATSAPFYVGGRVIGGYPFIGEIAEVIFYARELTSAEITSVNAYINAKYGPF